MQLLWLCLIKLVLLPLTRKPGLCITYRMFMLIYFYCESSIIYIYSHTCISSFPGLISVAQVNEWRTTDVTRECLKHQVLSFAKMLGVVNEQKIFCFHQCSPEYVCKISLRLNWIMWEPCKYCDTWIVRPLVCLSWTSKTLVPIFLYSNNLIKVNSPSCFKWSSQWTINK